MSSSAGIARRESLAGRAPVGTVLLALVLAVAAFVVAFEAGRLTRHHEVHAEVAPTSFRVASADSAIPLSLALAPPIDLGATHVAARPSKPEAAPATESLPVVVPSTPSTAPAVTSIPPPATPAPPASTPSGGGSAPSSGGAPSRSSSGSGSGSGSGKGGSGGGFDTSG